MNYVLFSLLIGNLKVILTVTVEFIGLKKGILEAKF